MENQILIDPMVKPDNNVLQNVLGKNFKRFSKFLDKINDKKLILEWNYYKDGKCWLGKVLNKKKNLCWLSVWNTGFKLTFYFTEKTVNGINELEIEEETKIFTKINKPIGKLIPIIILIGNEKALNDGVKIIDYKMGLK